MGLFFGPLLSNSENVLFLHLTPAHGVVRHIDQLKTTYDKYLESSPSSSTRRTISHSQY